MADQGKWFKLHVGWDDDPHIDSLSEQDQLRWVKFGTYMKEHGTEGTIVLIEPARNLQNKFHVSSFEDVISALKKFPNYVVGEKQIMSVTGVTNVTVTIKNWMRYQGDFSRDRMRKFRIHVTAKKRGEEKRREETRKEENRSIPKSLSFSKPTPEEVTAYAKTINFNLDGRKFCDHYEANGWRVGKSTMKNWQAAVRTWRSNDYGGYANGINGGKSPVSYIAKFRAEKEAEKLRSNAGTDSVPPGFRDLSDIQSKTGPGR